MDNNKLPAAESIIPLDNPAPAPEILGCDFSGASAIIDCARRLLEGPSHCAVEVPDSFESFHLREIAIYADTLKTALNTPREMTSDEILGRYRRLPFNSNEIDYETARVLYQLGNEVSALAILNDIRDADHRVLHLRGALQLRQGNYLRAHVNLEKALESVGCPDYLAAEAMLYIARIYRDTWQLPTAIAYLERAIRRSTVQTLDLEMQWVLWRLWTGMMPSSGELDELAARSTATNGDQRVRNTVMLSTLYRESGDLTTALAKLDTCSTRNPGLLLEMAITFMTCGSPRGAEILRDKFAVSSTGHQCTIIDARKIIGRVYASAPDFALAPAVQFLRLVAPRHRLPALLADHFSQHQSGWRRLESGQMLPEWPQWLFDASQENNIHAKNVLGVENDG